MRFDTKIGIAVRDDLPVWQRLNVTAFLASAVAAAAESVIGEPYEDGSGNRYLAMFRQPVLVYAAPDTRALALVRERAVARDLLVAVYTDDMFKTGHDEANRAVVRAVAADDLVLAGLAVYGRRNDADKALKGLPLHG
ncbi:MAG: DUF2000 family protein [Mycobacteriales bacterium]